MTMAILALALLQQPARPSVPPAPVAVPPASDTTPPDTTGRPCHVTIDTVGHFGRQVEIRPGVSNFFAGGGVQAHCQGTHTTLVADSTAWYADVGRLDMLGSVHIRDSTMWIDSQTASYYLHQEMLEAHKDVVATNRVTGTVLRGPNLTYYRVARGVRDTTEMFASERPTIDYRTSPDSGEPTVIVADRVRQKGADRIWCGGQVTVDRSDLAAQADSMLLDETAGVGVLIGQPSISGKGPSPFHLVGRRITLGLHNHDVREVRALGDGVATSADWHLTADTIQLALEQRRLQQIFAWGDSTRPHAVSTLTTIDSDSLALDMPNQVLKEARAFRHALSTSKRDSASNERNWIAGDTIVADWKHQGDSAGHAQVSLNHVVARGAARALTHLHDEHDSTRTPSLNYSRGAVIDILLHASKIDRVLVTGRADGIQLEPFDTTKAAADTTKAHRAAADSAKKHRSAADTTGAHRASPSP
jgi:hypothetical protein